MEIDSAMKRIRSMRYVGQVGKGRCEWRFEGPGAVRGLSEVRLCPQPDEVAQNLLLMAKGIADMAFAFLHMKPCPWHHFFGL